MKPTLNAFSRRPPSSLKVSSSLSIVHSGASSSLTPQPNDTHLRVVSLKRHRHRSRTLTFCFSDAARRGHMASYQAQPLQLHGQVSSLTSSIFLFLRPLQIYVFFKCYSFIFFFVELRRGIFVETLTT